MGTDSLQKRGKPLLMDVKGSRIYSAQEVRGLFD